MSEAELSSEIIKIERGLMEMKREYKNLLAKTQVTSRVKNLILIYFFTGRQCWKCWQFETAFIRAG